jgi:hypothetical protein
LCPERSGCFSFALIVSLVMCNSLFQYKNSEILPIESQAFELIAVNWISSAEAGLTRPSNPKPTPTVNF